MAKMHQIRFRLGLRPDTAGVAYTAPPDPVAGFKGPASKKREGEGREWRVLSLEGAAKNPLKLFVIL